ncbi:MAG: YggS family pyridoxal phosphate-dependent enzyme [Acidobacteriota bacterium]
MSIKDNLAQLRERINAAATSAGRAVAEIRLVAVTKTVSTDKIKEAIAAGITDIGENRVQEADDKVVELSNLGLCYHLIGHLQANKVRRAVELFDFIHSVDSIKLAERLNRVAGELGRRPVVLAQVNIGKEETKSGIDEAQLMSLAKYLAACQHLNFRGLMAMPPFLADAASVRPYFRRLRDLLALLNAGKISALPLTELSIGMSHDFEAAIAEGATIIRVGTAIFGAR